VATLAERAAQKLNLNVELVRTGTLYHDIGKMLQARYFIENQMGSLNPHTQLDDPYRSAQIIKAHVSDGLRLAKQYNLPTAVQAFIPEHQGTILIAYFYHQAQMKSRGSARTRRAVPLRWPDPPEQGDGGGDDGRCL
jgi:putative nucleotidyltransferase with HDIG domain